MGGGWQRGIPAEPISPGGSIPGVPVQGRNAPGFCETAPTLCRRGRVFSVFAIRLLTPGWWAGALLTGPHEFVFDYSPPGSKPGTREL